MGMLYPPPLVSHHISLQLMLQREFHVITLALLSCPRERGERSGRDGEAEEEEEEEEEKNRETIKNRGPGNAATDPGRCADQ